MSQHQAFMRAPVPAQVAQHLETVTLPAPTRGIIMDENFSYMQPGGCLICDNWKPTLRGVALRGGCTRWCDLHAYPAWLNGHAYTVNTKVTDTDGSSWNCAVAHTSAASGTFTADRVAHPTYWTSTTPLALTDPSRLPIISGFQYASGVNQRIFAANATNLYDVTNSVPTLVQSGQHSGNYCASQLANQGGDFLLAVNDAGDPPLRFNGATWVKLDPSTIAAWLNNTAYAIGAYAKDLTDGSYWRCLVAHTSAAAGTFAADRTAHPAYWTSTASDNISWIVGPAGTNVVNGANLSYVCKYRNRFFFIELNSMNAWYLPLNAAGGMLAMIPLSGAATRGGKLLWCATWSLDAGDGIDDKLVFCTDLGELLIFTGSDPSSVSNWRQEGRYQVPAPMGMNAHIPLGGDLLIATTSGIVPISASITKTSEELELAMITKSIKPMWRDEVAAKRSWNWSMFNWAPYGGIFVTWPGGNVGNRYCAVVNGATGAWARFVGYDALCFMGMRDDMYFGTQSGIVMQADRTGFDDGQSFLATLVGGWEMFQSPSQTITWRQARAMFYAPPGQPFQPQISACTDFVVTLPAPPPPGPDPGLQDAWDQGHWGPDMGGPPPPVPTTAQRAQYAQWDQPVSNLKVVGNTLWISIGLTGFTHAPIVQVTVAQQAKPDVELISIAATFERAGINV